MRIYDIILKKRNGKTLSEKEINFFVSGCVNGSIPDYQTSALLMAIYFKGLDNKETVDLVKAMVNSGDVLNLSRIKKNVVDKHSTGGVGDKTSIVLGPMVAACGIAVAKLSGRGLGHTGGTIDKLESFTGFSTEISEDAFIKQVNKVGLAIGSQTQNLVPADKKLYALRDVTATVDNISLIAGSIMSKKIASGAKAIVLDVKTGSGAFMKDTKSAFELAKLLVKIGTSMGRQTAAVVTNMDEPLGNAVGNSLEVIESINTLKGNGPKDLLGLCYELGSQMLMLGGTAKNKADAIKKLENAISSGKAFEKFKDFIVAQGGNPIQTENLSLLPKAKYEKYLIATQACYVKCINAETIGISSLMLGAGRETKESKIDLAAGIYLHKKVGMFVNKGEKLATLLTNDQEKISNAFKKLLSAYTFSKSKVTCKPLILGIVTRKGIKMVE